MPPEGHAPLRSVRVLLLWLVLACILPGAVGGGLLFFHEYQDDRAELEQDTTQTVRALAQAVDSQLARAQIVAQSLASSSYLSSGDFAAFHRQARSMVEATGLGTNVVLSDKQGQQVVNTLRAIGEPLPSHGNPEQLRRVFATGQPVVSDIYVGGVTGKPVMSIDVPVMVDGKVVYDLSVGIAPDLLGKVLRSQQLPPDWMAVVVDRSGTIVARTHLSEKFVGQKAVPEFIRRMSEVSEGTLEASTREGIPSLMIYSRSQVSDWTVAISIPRQSLEARLKRTVSLLGLGVATLFALGVGLAWFAASRIAQSVRALTGPAIALGTGDTVSMPSVYVHEAQEVAGAIETAARLLAQREAALHEAHELLRDHEAELAKAQAIARLGSWYWDAATDVFAASDELRRIHGREAMPPFAEQIGTLYDPEAWQQLDAAFRMALETGTCFELELPALRDDGTPLWIHMRGEPARDASGQVVGLRGTTQDITKRKAVDQALADAQRWHEQQLEQLVSERTGKLRESEDRFRTLFEGAPVGQLLIHPDSLRILECNQAAADIHGYSRDELCRMAIPDLGATLDEGEVREILQRLLAKEKVQFETRVLRKDGRLRDLSVTVMMLGSAEGDRIHATHMDVTERKRAEREQQRLNRTLRLRSDCNIALVRADDEDELLGDLCRVIVESGGYLMCWVGVPEQDPGKSVRRVAQSGHEQGYLEGVRISWDGDCECGRGPTGTAIRTGFSQVVQNCLTSPIMAPWREAAGKRGYQSTASLPLLCGGRVLGALTLYSAEPDAFDADEVGTLEELAGNVAYGIEALRGRRELERHQEQLEKLVSERTRKIAALNTELIARAKDAESANVAKSTFLATMSHELRTPLAAVVGLTGLLADSPLDRQQRDYADKIQSSALALRGLIDNILDFSKIEAGALRLEHAPFSLGEILRQTATTLSIGTRGKAVEALVDVAADVPEALIGDALRLQQILLNLANNAVKFTETGEILVAVRCLARGATSASLLFAVRDTGIGIPADKLDAIFDEFSQADSSTSRKYGGSGLGLAICARLAGLMGGRIEVESQLGRGSEFRFTVTLALAESQPAASPTETLAGMRILIIDDCPLARDVLGRTCAGFGWQVTTIESGAAGLDELRRSAADGNDYDVLLLDWRMPGMDGVEMIRRAQAGPGIGLPLVVLMAATFELEQAIAASDDLHLDGIVAKPVTPASLFDAIVRAHSGETVELVHTPGPMTCQLAGMRLLVAEDNELNQQVVQQLLTRAGAQVQIVGNGLAAVEALQAPGACYDAVLMDIQMPVMDGYAAARVIRDELGLVDLPIIAVTAYARQEDRDSSVRAGMAGHVTKPIDIDRLLELLGGRRNGRCADVPVPAIDLPGLDVAAALKAFGGDGIQYGELLRNLTARSGGDIEEARRLFVGGDAAGAARLLHDLSGIASLLRATDVARLAALAEAALRSGDGDVVPTLFDRLQVAMDVLQKSIDRFRRAPPYP